MNSKRIFVNALTFARVPLIFLWAILTIVAGSASTWSPERTLAFMFAGCVSGMIGAFTDLFDGKLARKWGVVSALGKMADPLMDKVFFLVAFPTLLWLSSRVDLPHQGAHTLVLLAFTMFYLLRDTWVTFLRSVGSMYGADVAAMWLGKLRTALAFPVSGCIFAYLGFVPSMLELGWISSAVAHGMLVLCFALEGFMLFLTLWTLVTYTRAYAPYLKKALERK